MRGSTALAMVLALACSAPAGAAFADTLTPYQDAAQWYKAPKATLDAERERRHADTEKAIQAARDAAFLLGAAACDGDTPAYRKAKAAYERAFQAATDAAAREAGLDQDVAKAARAAVAALDANNKLPASTSKDLKDKSDQEWLTKSRAYREAVAVIVGKMLADADLKPAYDACYKPAKPAQEAEAKPAGTPPPAPKKVIGFWAGESPKRLALERKRRHDVVLASIGNTRPTLNRLTSLGCSSPEDTFDEALSTYDAAYARTATAISFEMQLSPAVLAAWRNHGDIDGAQAGAEAAALDAFRLPPPGSICAGTRAAITYAPTPGRNRGTAGTAAYVPVDPRHETTSTEVKTDLRDLTPHGHGGCPPGGGAYVPPPPPPMSPPPPP